MAEKLVVSMYRLGGKQARREAMDRKVVLSLYRMLYRSARAFDRAPALKALLRSEPTKRYDATRSMWVEMAPLADRGRSRSRAQALQDDYSSTQRKLFSKYMSEILGGGAFYRPYTSAKKIVRIAFRKSIMTEEEKQARIDAGFLAMKGLSMIMNLADSALRKDPEEMPARDFIDIDTIRQPELCKSPNDLQSGAVLVAHPLVDGPFSRKLILLVDYDASLGASGVVINGPAIARVSVEELLNAEPSKAAKDAPTADIYFGGPVMSKQEKQWLWGQSPAEVKMQILHSHGDLRGAVAVTNGVYLGFQREDAYDKYMAGELAAEDLLILQGYSGWGPNQLEGELAQHSWFASKISDVGALIRARRKMEASKSNTDRFFADVKTGFFRGEERLWEQVLQSLGGEYADFSRFLPATE